MSDINIREYFDRWMLDTKQFRKSYNNDFARWFSCTTTRGMSFMSKGVPMTDLKEQRYNEAKKFLETISLTD